MTSKERARLRGLANGLDAIVHVGKNGIAPEITVSLDEALAARELVKIAVLNNSPVEPAEAAETLAARTQSEIVQIVGRKIVLWRCAEDGKK